uniref:Uncharacterized protein n=1 Tax=viral metagenome TaxID=1070528 RepID=A0A6C0E232_9ZZZZ
MIDSIPCIIRDIWFDILPFTFIFIQLLFLYLLLTTFYFNFFSTFQKVEPNIVYNPIFAFWHYIFFKI